MSQGFELLLVVLLVPVLLVALGMLVYERRQRRQLQALVSRLAEIEERRADDQGSSADESVQEPRAGPTAADHRSPSDPLAGMTTHVQMLVGGSADFEAATLADQAITVVHRHLEESFSPGMLADELNVSIRTLERGLAHALSCTPGQLITAMKMREARRLLASGRYRVTEVASRLAFSTPQYFSRRFKAFFGHSPSLITRDG